MPNVMVAMPNIGGALCSTPQKFGWRQLLDAVQYCFQDAKPVEIAGVLQTGQPISANPFPQIFRIYFQ